MASTDDLIFWYAPTIDEEEDIGFDDEIPLEEDQAHDKNAEGKGKGRESMYVSLVEGMVKTVLEKEGFLFSEEELSFFTAYSTLSYKARYLLARLLVRKTGKWYRLDQLKYVSELGTEGIAEAVKELCGTLGSRTGKQSSRSLQSSLHLRSMSSCENIIDLVSDDERKILLPAPAEWAPVDSDKEIKTSKGSLDYYAEDESHASLSDLLKCLTVEELKGLAKTLKLSNAITTRTALVEGLLAYASSQTTLGGFASSDRPRLKRSAKDSKSVKLKQVCLSFKPASKTSMQVDILRDLVLKTLKRCIRINDAINALFHRLHIVYFRSTEHPTSLLTPALLRRCRKRYYPLYTYVRSAEIFPSREALIAYEDALRMEAAVDLMLEGNIDVELAKQHIDAWVHNREKDANTDKFPPHTLRPRQMSPDGIDDPGKENTPCPSVSQIRIRSASVSTKIELDDDDLSCGQEKESQAMANAKYVISVFERVYPRWQKLVRQRGELEARPKGLERFDEGYILTRIIYKGATAYGKLKDFDREIALLRELLAQRRWRRSKRGAWYDRWALVLMHHIVRRKREVNGELVPLSREKQKVVLREAMDVVIKGLHDEDTHIVSRQALERRLTRLENRLKAPIKERHECIGKLEKAEETTITGERVRSRHSNALGKAGKAVNRAIVPVSVRIQGEEAVRKHLDQLKKERARKRWTGKSLWLGKTGEEVNVETLVLHHYELDGYKGFHSEASIISTIWGLLFWDILFSSVPGAFETPYQSAPLDIASECFYFARKESVEKRLQEIGDGRAPEILAETDDKYRGNNTVCVGVRWNDFSKQDLVEIVTCLGGEGLSMVCRLFCEDYGGRHSGVPDLIVWRMDDKLAKFVEVKGPGDNLSENQKVWIDVLRQAGINAEVCRVVDRDRQNAQAMRGAPKNHRVIRVYRISDGNACSPIDVDAECEPETELDVDTQEDVLDKHVDKKRRTE